MPFFALHAQKIMLISICIPRKSPLLQRGEQGIKLGEDGALGGFEGFDDLDDKRKKEVLRILVSCKCQALTTSGKLPAS